jgi:hypothetical protein
LNFNQEVHNLKTDYAALSAMPPLKNGGIAAYF